MSTMNDSEVATSAPPSAPGGSIAPAGFRSALVVAGAFLSALGVSALVQQSTRVLGWAVAAAVVAMLIGGLITFLERFVGHRFAVAITTVGLFAIAGVVAFRTVTEIRREIRNLEIAVPRAVDRLERSDGLGRALREFGLKSKVDRFLDELPNRLGGTPAEMARTAGSRGAALVAGLVLACFICAGGRRSFEGVMCWVPERKGRMLNRHAITQMVERAYRRTSDLLLFSVAKAALIGVSVGVLFGIAGVPGPTVLGLMFALASLVPGVGVVLAAIVSYSVVIGLTNGVDRIVSLVALSGAIVVDRLLERRAHRRGMLDVGPAAGFAGFFGGFEFGGIGTALCLLAITAFLGAMWSEYCRLRAYWRPVDESELSAEAEAELPHVGGFGAGSLGRLYFVTFVAVGAALAALGIARSMHQTGVLVLIAVVIALALERLTGPLADRVGGRRRVAMTIVCSAIVAFFVLIAVFLVPAVSTKAASFGTELPQMAERLHEVPVFGKVLREANAPQKVEQWLDQLPSVLGRQSSRITDALGGAVDLALSVGSVVILALAFVIDGPRLTGSLRSVLPPKRRRTYDQTTRLVIDVVGRYFAGSLFIAMMAGIVSLSVGLALGVVLAPLAAIWIATTNLIPQVGGFLGGVVFVALGFATNTTVGLVCLAYFLTYQQIENQVVQPAVIGRAVSMSPAATMVIALVGGSALGIPGAMIAVPIVGAVKLVARHLAGESVRSAEHNDRYTFEMALQRVRRTLGRRIGRV